MIRAELLTGLVVLGLRRCAAGPLAALYLFSSGRRWCDENL
jgi:hypothetical protein